MWVNRENLEFMRKNAAAMEQDLISQRNRIKFLEDFCRSVANTEGLSMLSYQQLHEPTEKNRERVGELFEMSERRRAQLIQEGTDPEKLKEIAVRFFEIMQEKDFSIKEADAASAILSNMVESAHHRNPNEKLKDIG